jgi:hypothetical protein
LSKELGRSFHGAHILGVLATALEAAEAKRRALAEAEALIAAGCVSHNQLRFYPDAMNVALELGDLDEVERYAAADRLNLRDKTAKTFGLKLPSRLLATVDKVIELTGVTSPIGNGAKTAKERRTDYHHAYDARSPHPAQHQER